MAKVLVLTLDGTGDSRQLAGGALSVGRGQDNDWILVDPGPTPTVSRRHCRFAFGPEGATVTDLGSTNGTRVDGRALSPRTPATLRGGETIEVGARRMSVEMSEPWMHGGGLSAPTPPPPRPDGGGPDRHRHAECPPARKFAASVRAGRAQCLGRTVGRG